MEEVLLQPVGTFLAVAIEPILFPIYHINHGGVRCSWVLIVESPRNVRRAQKNVYVLQIILLPQHQGTVKQNRKKLHVRFIRYNKVPSKPVRYTIFFNAVLYPFLFLFSFHFRTQHILHCTLVFDLAVWGTRCKTVVKVWLVALATICDRHRTTFVGVGSLSSRVYGSRRRMQLRNRSQRWWKAVYFIPKRA